LKVHFTTLRIDWRTVGLALEPKKPLGHYFTNRSAANEIGEIRATEVELWGSGILTWQVQSSKPPQHLFHCMPA